MDEVEGEWKKEDNTPIDSPYQCVAGPRRGVVSPMCTILDAFYVFLRLKCGNYWCLRRMLTVLE